MDPNSNKIGIITSIVDVAIPSLLENNDSCRKTLIIFMTCSYML